MAFIATVPVQDASGEVQAMYARQQAQLGYVPNYSKVFSHRPEVNSAWGALLGSIRATLEARRYELVTLAAAQALRSSYCSLAHGQILHREFLPGTALENVVRGADDGTLSALDRAIMAYAAQIARDASQVTAQQVQGLRDLGLSDTEIFDVAAAASARCFFSKLLDALGTLPDSAYADLEGGLREALTVGREISGQEVERLPG